MDCIRFETLPTVHSFAAIAGHKESEGNFGRYFDRIEHDATLGETTWERAETRLQAQTLSLACAKGLLKPAELDCILAGDLIDQCTVSSLAARDTNVPFCGIYGACSTMAQALLLAGIFTDGGYVQRAGAVTSSHFSTAERQFRAPLSYGGQRTPTAQWTCTASGAAIITRHAAAPYLAGGCIGRIVDLGVTDPTNMGAAMAPAAADTITRYLAATDTAPGHYDLILTGDLGKVGTPLLRELMQGQGLDIADVHADCGAMLFSEEQDTHAGGSGCGCAASLLCAYYLPKLAAGELHRILFCATGALLSAMSTQQGESIPGICHLVELVG